MPEFPNLIEWFYSVWKDIVSVVWLPVLSFVLGWIGRRIYDTKLRSPVRMYFLIPDKRCKLSYANQDNEEHLIEELVLPSNSESQVLIWFKPRVNYYEDSIYFGCKGDLNKKPWVIDFSNPFVLDNNLQRSYYRDWHQHYHILTGRSRIKEEVYVSGFVVKTFEEGEYEANVFLHTPSKLGRAKLKITVKNAPSTKILCLMHKESKRKIKKLFMKNHKKHYVKFITC
jgi:hypothetical protein